MKLALECGLKLQNTIDKKFHSNTYNNYHASLGKVVQKIFELYFNQGVNLKPRGQLLVVRERVVEKVLNSSYFKNMEITYPVGTSEDGLKTEIRRHAKQAFEVLEREGLLRRKISSEREWSANFRGLPIFGKIDFFLEDSQAVEIYDGKGTKNANADPGQLLHYALLAIASDRKLRRAGFIYWNHGLKEVDVSPEAMKRFIDTDFARGRAVFEKLRQGVDKLPANPSKGVCGLCPWKSSCEYSVYKVPERVITQNDEVKFS